MSAGPPKTPLATVDIVIETAGGIVLVRRRNPPPGWALPGGFVDPGESVAQAARREAKEETGLDVELTDLLAVYSDPKRDPRGIFTISTAFIARERAPGGRRRRGGGARGVARRAAARHRVRPPDDHRRLPPLPRRPGPPAA